MFIWPIGAERPFVSDGITELKNYLHSQSKAWLSVAEESPNQRFLKEYVNQNLARIGLVDSILQGVHGPDDWNRAYPGLLAIVRDKNMMWIDASSKTGQDLIFNLRKNNTNRFAQIEAKAHADWERRIKDLDASSSRSLINDEKPNPGAQALAKALLGETSTEDDTIANTETRLRTIIDSAKFAMAEILQATETADKESQATIDRARIEIDKMLEAAGVSLKAMQADSLEKTSRLQVEQGRILEQIEPKIAELNKSLTEFTRGLDEKSKEIPKIEGEIAGLTAQVAEKIKNATAAIAAHEEAHRQQLVLRAPIVYWMEKQNAHKKVYWSALAIFIVINASALGFFGVHFESIWQHLKEVQGQNAGVLNVTGLVAFTLPSVAYFWILKHISRIFVDNMSNANDAGQRSVMLQTYLALVAEPASKVSEQERLLALNALFRPSATAGSDDAPPSNLLEILTKAGDKKPS